MPTVTWTKVAYKKDVTDHAALITGVHGLVITAGQTLTLTTSLTNNTGAGTLTWPAAGATLTIPTGGGTLGSAAFTATGAYDAAGVGHSEATDHVGTHESTYSHTNYNTAYGWGNWNASGLTTGYIPYKPVGTLANSPIYTDGTNVGIGCVPATVTLDITKAGANTWLSNTTGSTAAYIKQYSVSFAANVYLPSAGVSASHPYWYSGIADDSSAGWSLWTYNGSAFIQRVRVDENGNVGIGKIPVVSLDIGTGINNYTKSIIGFGITGFMGACTNDYPMIGNNVIPTGSVDAFKYVYNDYASFIKFSSGGIQFYIAPSGTAGNAISATQVVTILNGGNVTFSGSIFKSLETSITASTTQTQAGATALTKDINVITVCAHNYDSVRLPPAVVGREVTVINKNTGFTLDIWPASGDDCGQGTDQVQTAGTGTAWTFIASDDARWYQM